MVRSIHAARGPEQFRRCSIAPTPVPLKIHVVAVGTRQPEWVDCAFSEYAKRMPREASVELIEIKPEKRASGKSTQQILTAECTRIRAALPAYAELLALDERGSEWSTRELAQFLERSLASGRDLAFLIGGADGLHADLKRAAGRQLSLSRMTLPHGLARVLLAEQLYRAMSLLRNHPYHRE